jgi:ATP-dependent Clp protease ATP-binding subunit ClpA
MLDEGHITSANGKKVDCKNTLIIMTSNLGARDNENNAIGFGSQEKSGNEDRAMKEFFKPELRNRIDQICKFNKLDTLAIKKIVVKFVNELKTSLTNKNIRLDLSEAVVDLLADKGYDKKMGARPLARKIDELIKVPLSKKILFDQLTDCTVRVEMINNAVEFVVIPTVTPMVDSNGFICVENGNVNL